MRAILSGTGWHNRLMRAFVRACAKSHATGACSNRRSSKALGSAFWIVSQFDFWQTETLPHSGAV